jgi:hypothetical protein
MEANVGMALEQTNSLVLAESPPRNISSQFARSAPSTPLESPSDAARRN